MAENRTDTERTAGSWSIGTWREFWNAPTVQGIRTGGESLLDDDVVGVWPHGTVVRGRQEYVEGIVRLLERIPDFRAVPKEVASSGDCDFIRWEATGTWNGEPFTAIGTDRVKHHDAKVTETLIMSDHPAFVAVRP